MALNGDNLEQLTRYGRVARNSQMLLVMEPPPVATPAVEEAREAIAEDAVAYLNEVERGVESPYFVAYSRKDAPFVESLAAEKVRRAEWDRVGLFDVAAPKIRMSDSTEAQAATFAFIAASCMRQIKAPFYQAPGLRTSVQGPRNLAEFVRTIDSVRDVTMRARGKDFRNVVARNEWRVAFAFWEANKWLAGAIHRA